ncbi:hypothetical protein BC828DRAFT_399574 [Blastocladiella britannica]|nr:hypothetical protein BC828DRAFT_399574 [Blastocladiella britannica]
MGSDPTLVTSLFAYLVPLVSDMELYPLQGTPAVQHARRVRAAREQRIKAKAESSLDRLALDGDKDEVAQRLVTATRENDSLHSTIAALSTQLADLHEQIKIAAALKDDSEAHLVTATDLRTVAAAQAARLADQLAAATAEADSARRARAAAEDKMEAQSRELAVTSARLRQVETGLEQVQAEKTALEFRVKGMAHELGGEAGQAEELAIEFIKVLGRAEVAEKTKQAMADREQQLLRRYLIYPFRFGGADKKVFLVLRVKDLDYERNALTEKVTLLTASTGPKTRATSTPTDAHSLGPEVILVIQRVEADLGTQLGAMNADLAQCREQLHDVTSTFRQRLQHYIDATCQINPNNETLTTLKKIVDAMHKDVLSAVVNSERSAMDGVFGCHKLVSASHQLILHLLRLVMILQGGGGGKATASLQKAIDETEMHHRAFQTVTQSLQALRSPAHTHAATIPVPTVPRVQAQPDPRAEIAAYIQQTHRQLEEERAELLTRALVAEGMVKLLLGSRPH